MRSVIIEVGVCDRLQNENFRFITFLHFTSSSVSICKSYVAVSERNLKIAKYHRVIVEGENNVTVFT